MMAAPTPSHPEDSPYDEEAGAIARHDVQRRCAATVDRLMPTLVTACAGRRWGHALRLACRLLGVLIVCALVEAERDGDHARVRELELLAATQRRLST